MKNIRQQLLAVHRLREDRAERAVVALHRKYIDADIQLAREQRQLDAWRLRAQDEEAELYASLWEALVKPRQIDRVKLQIDALWQRTREHERSVERALSDCEQAREALQQAKVTRLEMSRARQKAAEVWHTEQKAHGLMLERKADDELDEISTQSYGRV